DAVRGLVGDGADLLEQIDLLLYGAVRGLDQRDRLVGVRGRLRHAADLGLETLGRDEARRIVGRAVDGEARGQFLLEGAGLVRGVGQRIQGEQRRNVGVDGAC